LIIETTGQDHSRRIIEILKGEGYMTSVAYQG